MTDTPPQTTLAPLITMSEQDNVWCHELHNAQHAAFSLVTAYLQKAAAECDAQRAEVQRLRTERDARPLMPPYSRRQVDQVCSSQAIELGAIDLVAYAASTAFRFLKDSGPIGHEVVVRVFTDVIIEAARDTPDTEGQ